jgi:hypothetical protein
MPWLTVNSCAIAFDTAAPQRRNRRCVIAAPVGEWPMGDKLAIGHGRDTLGRGEEQGQARAGAARVLAGAFPVGGPSQRIDARD